MKRVFDIPVIDTPCHNCPGTKATHSASYHIGELAEAYRFFVAIDKTNSYSAKDKGIWQVTVIDTPCHDCPGTKATHSASYHIGELAEAYRFFVH